MSDTTHPKTGYSAVQIEILSKRGISAELAEAAGVLAIDSEKDLPAGSPEYWTVETGYLPGLLFPWDSTSGGERQWQLRPDEAVFSAGTTKKYVFAPDAPSILNNSRGPGGESDGVLITEGTCQTIAAARYAPAGWAVYGIAGCQSWVKRGVPTRDLAVVEGREVLIALDADAATNFEVYDAGVRLREACLIEGAASVRFVRVPGGGKSGLDDVLGSQDEDRRTAYLERLLEHARARPKSEKPEAPAAAKPKRKKGAGSGDGAELDPFLPGGVLQVKTLSETILGGQPAAVTPERKVALYLGGVYRLDGSAFQAATVELLGERWRLSHLANAEAFTFGALYSAGTTLPERLDVPLMNVLNGMVDLRSGELLPHDPAYMSAVQFPVMWDPEATCPTYDAWLPERVGDQEDDLEEVASTMLDPSLTPSKAIFLFGPSRSGKSTFLRIMQAICGRENRSAVSLHALAQDKFAAANCYGMALNVCADVSSAHIEDISIFKLLTGEDPVTANRKFGQQFTFTNQALFAFSANKLPTVSESSRAYSERIKPFRFPATFAGHEDPTLEQAMLTELPGILRRWVAAYGRRLARGHALPTAASVRDEFELRSDRVRQFSLTALSIGEVVTVRGGSRPEAFATSTELYAAFRDWADTEGHKGMAKSNVIDRLRSIPGVTEVRDRKGRRGWNVQILPKEQWNDLGLTDKTDMSSAMPDKTDTVPATPATFNHPGENLDSIHSLVDHEKYVFNSKGGGSAKKLPELPELPEAQLSPLDRLLTANSEEATPECDVCGSDEILIDGQWFTCPSCYPATARLTATTTESE